MQIHDIRLRYLLCIATVTGCSASTATSSEPTTPVVSSTPATPTPSVAYAQVEWRVNRAVCLTTTHPRCGPMIQLAAGEDCAPSTRSCEAQLVDDLTEEQRRDHPNACCYTTQITARRRILRMDAIEGRPFRLFAASLVAVVAKSVYSTKWIHEDLLSS